MRVFAAIVVPPHLSVSGGARAAENLSLALSRDCDVTVGSMMNGAGLESSNTGPARLPVRSWIPQPLSRLPNRYRALFYRSDLSAHVARGRYDLVHLHNPMPALELNQVANTCLARGIPYVISTHGFNEIFHGASVYGFDRLRALAWDHLALRPVSRAVRRAAAIFALSEADTPIIRAMGFKGTIWPVPNGVPIPEPVPPGTDRPLLETLGIAPDKDPNRITCLFLANHTPNKGLPNLLAAFSKLDCPFQLIVGGEKRDGIDYDRFVGGCRPGQEIRVTGRLTDAQVGALFRRADLFVFPTLADTFPLVVLEAMSHAVPVLASRVGGIPHQIDANCGALVEPGDIDALTAKLRAFAAAPHSLPALGQKARARVTRHFTWERAAQSALEGYREVLGRRRTAPNPHAAPHQSVAAMGRC